MSTMQALVIQSTGKAAVTQVKQPDLRNDYVKIKVTAVALNPST